MNLVINASEAIGDADGEIRLAVSRVKVAHDRLAWIPEELAEGDYVQMEVADTGSGMAPETQARIFDPFFTTKPLGHGLGLAVVSGIVRSLTGAIDFASEPGKGTTVRVLLPCAQSTANAATGPNSHAASTHAGHGETVLIVEDEDPLLCAAAKILRRSGLSVLEAADGTAAIAAIRGGGPIKRASLQMSRSPEFRAGRSLRRPNASDPRMHKSSLPAHMARNSRLQSCRRMSSDLSGSRIRCTILWGWFVKHSRECVERARSLW